jgi:hypothetical protein
MLEMLLIPLLMSVSAVVLLRSKTCAIVLPTLEKQKPPDVVRLPSTLANETLSVSDAPEPTWNWIVPAVPSSSWMPLNREVFC